MNIWVYQRLVMSPSINLKSGAVFISDAHENATRKYFETFLKQVEDGVIPTPKQLFLMGDMFDLLVGSIEYSRKIHAEIISKIDALAKKIPVYYFEGNHDFALKALFKHVNVLPIASQPLPVKTPKGILLLLHGDKFSGDRAYLFYTKIIRSCVALKFLNLLDKVLGFKLSKKLLAFLNQKTICKKIEEFEQMTIKRLENYPLEGIWGVMEGHFHQGLEIKTPYVQYLNFPSFACERSYFVVQCVQSMQCAKLQLRGSDV